MKRSKIFLAAATCFLAIAGVAATKAHFGSIKAVYFTQGGRIGQKVLLTKQPCTISTETLKCFYVTVNHTQFPLYTATNAVKPLYYNAE
jgi:hypothetical protein